MSSTVGAYLYENVTVATIEYEFFVVFAFLDVMSRPLNCSVMRSGEEGRRAGRSRDISLHTNLSSFARN